MSSWVSEQISLIRRPVCAVMASRAWSRRLVQVVESGAASKASTSAQVRKCIGLSDDAAHRAFGIEPGEVVAAEIVVVDVVGQHVPGRGEDRVFDGDDGFRFTQSRREASVAGTEVGVVLGAGRGHRGGAQRAGLPPVAVTGLARFVFTGGFVVDRAHPGRNRRSRPHVCRRFWPGSASPIAGRRCAVDGVGDHRRRPSAHLRR